MYAVDISNHIKGRKLTRKNENGFSKKKNNAWPVWLPCVIKYLTIVTLSLIAVSYQVEEVWVIDRGLKTGWIPSLKSWNQLTGKGGGGWN